MRLVIYRVRQSRPWIHDCLCKLWKNRRSDNSSANSTSSWTATWTPAPETPLFVDHQAFLWDGTRKTMKPIKRPAHIDHDDLIGIESIKNEVVRNTKNFVDGRRANNVLLWGERGTGKSSLLSSLCSRPLRTRTSGSSRCISTTS